MLQDNVSFQGDRSKKIKSKTDARQRDSSKEKSKYLHNNSQSMSHESLETPIRDDDVIKEPLVGHQESFRTKPGSIAILHKTMFPDRATETNSVRSQYSGNSNVIEAQRDYEEKILQKSKPPEPVPFPSESTVKMFCVDENNLLGRNLEKYDQKRKYNSNVKEVQSAFEERNYQKADTDPLVKLHDDTIKYSERKDSLVRDSEQKTSILQDSDHTGSLLS